MTDPPYGISRSTNFALGEVKGTNADRFRISMDFGRWDTDFSGLSEVVTECFAGSAGTAVAAYNTGRNFIGCELSQTYFDKSMERLVGIGAIKENANGRTDDE